MPDKEFNEKKIPTMPQPAHSFFSRWLGLMINDFEKDLMTLSGATFFFSRWLGLMND